MNVPEEDKFESYIFLLEDFDARYVRHMWDITAEVSAVANFLREVNKTRSEKRAAIEVSPVEVWLHSQPAARRAFKALYGARRLPLQHGPKDEIEWATLLINGTHRIRTRSDYTDSYFMEKYRTPEDWAKFIDEVNSDEAKLRRLITRCDRIARNNFGGYRIGIAKAFFDYFYTKRYLQLATEAKQAPKAALTVLNAIETLFSQARDYEFLKLGNVPRHSLERIARTAQRYIDRHADIKYPVRRLDGTARERVLAYDLWTCFVNHFKSNKANAIFYFLGYEGVKNDLDLRAIERMTSEWSRCNSLKSGSS